MVVERMVVVAGEPYQHVDNLLNMVEVEVVAQTMLGLVVLYLVLVEVVEVKAHMMILMAVLGMISPKVVLTTDLIRTMQI